MHGATQIEKGVLVKLLIIGSSKFVGRHLTKAALAALASMPTPPGAFKSVGRLKRNLGLTRAILEESVNVQGE
jgi:hypothetical protein